ncbi:hypothetical protein F5Y05DRAFT_242326 [Hypoxylon sp. FL0543]|nr:hypothetical protein F5Y05DRAFT_242326 [Hypoxylon sp. FL0543]
MPAASLSSVQIKRTRGCQTNPWLRSAAHVVLVREWSERIPHAIKVEIRVEPLSPLLRPWAIAACLISRYVRRDWTDRLSLLAVTGIGIMVIFSKATFSELHSMFSSGANERALSRFSTSSPQDGYVCNGTAQRWTKERSTWMSVCLSLFFRSTCTAAAYEPYRCRREKSRRVAEVTVSMHGCCKCNLRKKFSSKARCARRGGEGRIGVWLCEKAICDIVLHYEAPGCEEARQGRARQVIRLAVKVPIQVSDMGWGKMD